MPVFLHKSRGRCSLTISEDVVVSCFVYGAAGALCSVFYTKSGHKGLHNTFFIVPLRKQ